MTRGGRVTEDQVVQGGQTDRQTQAGPEGGPDKGGFWEEKGERWGGRCGITGDRQ